MGKMRKVDCVELGGEGAYELIYVYRICRLLKEHIVVSLLR